jgi:hypothetical protein
MPLPCLVRGRARSPPIRSELMEAARLALAAVYLDRWSGAAEFR